MIARHPDARFPAFAALNMYLLEELTDYENAIADRRLDAGGMVDRDSRLPHEVSHADLETRQQT